MFDHNEEGTPTYGEGSPHYVTADEMISALLRENPSPLNRDLVTSFVDRDRLADVKCSADHLVGVILRSEPPTLLNLGSTDPSHAAIAEGWAGLLTINGHSRIVGTPETAESKVLTYCPRCKTQETLTAIDVEALRHQRNGRTKPLRIATTRLRGMGSAV